MYDDSKITDFQISANDLSLISERILKDDDLCKILYFDNDNPFAETITTEIKKDLFEKNYISIIPNIYATTYEKSGIIISFDNFMAGIDNPNYMSAIILFDILVPLRNWKIKSKDGKHTTLRPYEIAHLIHQEMNGASLTGIGKTNFASCSQILLPAQDKVAGLTVRYTIMPEDNNGWKLRNR